MVDQIRKDLPRVLLIIAHLRASIRMREGTHRLYIFPHKPLRELCDPACHIVDTANCRNDPDLVSDTDPAIFTVVSHEGDIVRKLFLSQIRLITVLEQIAQSCL